MGWCLSRPTALAACVALLGSARHHRMGRPEETQESREAAGAGKGLARGTTKAPRPRGGARPRSLRWRCLPTARAHGAASAAAPQNRCPTAKPGRANQRGRSKRGQDLVLGRVTEVGIPHGAQEGPVLPPR